MAAAPSAASAFEVNPPLMGDRAGARPSPCPCPRRLCLDVGGSPPGRGTRRGCSGEMLLGIQGTGAQPSWSIPGCAGALCMWLGWPRVGPTTGIWGHRGVQKVIICLGEKPQLGRAPQHQLASQTSARQKPLLSNPQAGCAWWLLTIHSLGQVGTSGSRSFTVS